MSRTLPLCPPGAIFGPVVEGLTKKSIGFPTKKRDQFTSILKHDSQVAVKYVLMSSKGMGGHAIA